ncbi:MAG TPA: F0F1 ATP synthase subunit delta [Paenalcaligenes hominis]|uniref:ATP synthase subunit delta n=1 Tax=Paenalcaligenes hominis TaxID=643674 RepID=A0A1U9K1E3_9BURK|nr:F0F1 ATP synthase subunit delta [Paenalcaligenes hominis]AQS51838.1 F0F1 ATP synthase subunit delta [Paenalcaligenes hominis]NJB64954.1 F-type H+-transporting ATPase subunit delta [Paenalcaligenes hominis]GGE57827.1 ATP synthase subunit delta [Paenalcaligenes hominis]HJH25076.1 F0F1 ATP synthase subunit delta [Paenalcaligenes hominis]
MAELSTIARPYAEALFASVRTEGTLEQWSALLSEMAQVAGHPEVSEVLTTPGITNQQRYELFTGLMKTPLTDKARNFLELLIDNGRLTVVPNIYEEFEALKHQLEGSELAQITSAFELSPEQLNKLVSALEKKFGLKLIPEVTVDAALIGGVRVMVGDQVLDTSVQAQLARMRDTLAA